MPRTVATDRLSSRLTSKRGDQLGNELGGEAHYRARGPKLLLLPFSFFSLHPLPELQKFRSIASGRWLPSLLRSLRRGFLFHPI